MAQQYSEAVVKLAKAHLKITQTLGFSKYYGNCNDEQIDYLRELEEDIRETLVLLGYDFKNPFWLEKENKI